MTTTPWRRKAWRRANESWRRANAVSMDARNRPLTRHSGLDPESTTFHVIPGHDPESTDPCLT